MRYFLYFKRVDFNFHFLTGNSKISFSLYSCLLTSSYKFNITIAHCTPFATRCLPSPIACHPCLPFTTYCQPFFALSVICCPLPTTSPRHSSYTVHNLLPTFCNSPPKENVHPNTLLILIIYIWFNDPNFL